MLLCMQGLADGWNGLEKYDVGGGGCALHEREWLEKNVSARVMGGYVLACT